MKKRKYYIVVVFVSLSIIMGCSDDESDGDLITPTATDFTDHLSNQVDEIIIPTMLEYRSKMNNFVSAVDSFASSMDGVKLSNLRLAYQEAYLAYQAAAVHNYFATANQALVNTSNLYPVDTSLLSNLIRSRAYNFNTEAQKRANGFPAIDFLLYGPSDVVAYFNADTNRISFLSALVTSMQQKSDALANQWSGNLRSNFVDNGGTALGSSISTQLNETLLYYEDHIRGNKVGIPIGRLGPNDSPITPDPTKIEAYYQSLFDGNENFTLSLVKASIEEMEDIYLGETPSKKNEKGYDDLLKVRNQAAVDTDIKARFASIYNKISNRNSISGDNSLYEEVQGLITIYKSELLPILNVQDADGLNDGD